jgi:asparagine synthase (glutamine-hydrolysing)
MCAILGWQRTGADGWDPAVLDRMAELLRHRGPDDGGSYRDAAAGLALGHRRLSIIDLSSGSHQPMLDHGCGVVLIYNGELYNFRELREELRVRGHQFRSSGDTEVVLRSYLQWGAACFDRFAGMFALAVWDPRSRTLHLARDATGMKPLYYVADSQGVAFASELKAFRALPGFRAQIDPHAMQQYLEFGYVFHEHRTMLQGVHKLPPGHRLEIRDGHIAANVAWFEPPAPQASDRRGENERLDEFGPLMERVVAEHLIADVPLGLLLSGGLDSSLVAALAARNGPLQTISMAFGGSSIDERANARQVSEFIGSSHTEVVIRPEDVKAEILGGAWVFDDLFADWGTVTTRMLYRSCRERGIKVVLVGEGADELFGGYDIFALPSRLGLWRQFRLYQRYCGRRHGKLFGEFHAIIRDYLEAGHGDPFHAVRLFESRRQLPNQYVMKVDKASMAESVEARAPFLDRRVAAFAYRTPREWLLRNGENKYLLRALARRSRLLPSEASGRIKFGAPLAASWMEDDPGFREFARGRLLDPGSQTRRLGLGKAMGAYYDQGRSGYRFPASLSLFGNLAWRLLLLELWSQHYLALGPA